jgi:hypothetical protein
MLCVVNCVADCGRLTGPQATERQRIGNQIDAAMIFARADFVKVVQDSSMSSENEKAHALQ